jgi:hypothetical protein
MSEQYYLELDPRRYTAQSFDWGRDSIVDITIDVGWQSDVRVLITQVEQSRVGKILLESIASHKKWIRIQWFKPGGKSDNGHCEARTDGTIGWGKSVQGEKRFYSATVLITPQNLGLK